MDGRHGNKALTGFLACVQNVVLRGSPAAYSPEKIVVDIHQPTYPYVQLTGYPRAAGLKCLSKDSRCRSFLHVICSSVVLEAHISGNNRMDLKPCRICGHEVYKAAALCPQCGVDDPGASAAVCVNCSKEVGPVGSELRVCPHCAENPRISVEDRESHEERIAKRVFLVGGVVALTLLGVALVRLQDTDVTTRANFRAETEATGPRLVIDPQQREFERKRSSLHGMYLRAPNEIRKSAIWTDANEWTRQFAEDRGWEVQDWYGRLSGLDTDQGGALLWLTVTSKRFGITVEYRTNSSRLLGADRTMLRKGSKVYDQARDLEVGDYVYFSAELIADGSKGIEELSFTELGSLSKPEFVVRFTDLRPAPDSD